MVQTSPPEVNIGMDEDPEDIVQLLERMPRWLEDLAKWLDEWSPMLARAIKPAYEFGGAFLLGG
jgi:hypothetical protein